MAWLGEGRSGARLLHCLPSKWPNTWARRYMWDGPGASSSKRRRSAMAGLLVSSDMLPKAIVSDRPVRPMPLSSGTPHSGPTRGNTTNNTAITGTPQAVSRSATAAAWRTVVAGPGIWARTTTVSRPQAPASISTSPGRVCACKNWVKMVKKPRKNTTKTSRVPRISKVLSANSKTTRATPASVPKKD